MRDAHIIGKRLVDEAMRLVNAQPVTEILVSKCAMSAAIQRVIHDFKHNCHAGMIRFDFLVDGHQRSVLINAAYIIQHGRTHHVQT